VGLVGIRYIFFFYLGVLLLGPRRVEGLAWLAWPGLRKWWAGFMLGHGMIWLADIDPAFVSFSSRYF
jgi:hypothetical protein